MEEIKQLAFQQKQYEDFVDKIMNTLKSSHTQSEDATHSSVTKRINELAKIMETFIFDPDNNMIFDVWSKKLTAKVRRYKGMMKVSSEMLILK